MPEPHPCDPSNAGLFKAWIATRGGVAIWRSLDMSQFWPNVWSLSDHGNLCLLSLTEE